MDNLDIITPFMANIETQFAHRDSIEVDPVSAEETTPPPLKIIQLTMF